MSLPDQLDIIKRVFCHINEEEAGFRRYTIVIHSMDTAGLKHEDYQHMLAEIASLSGVRLIVSVDNIKAGMLWSEQLIDKFNFMCLQVDTLQDYDTELEYQSPLFSFKNDNEEVGLAFVLKSMTQNQRGIIKVIAQHQLDNPQDKGIAMRDLMSKCVENMLAYSQKQIKDSLHEARDHKVVHERTDENGHQIFFMTYPLPLLEKLAADELN